MKKSLFTAALTALLITGVFASAAFAATWTANAGASVSDNGIILLDNTGGPTSYETNDLGLTISTGDVVSFDFEGLCKAGAPRLYFAVDGEGSYNTWNGNDEGDCGELVGNGTAPSGTVEYTYNGAGGEITSLYLVNDTATANPISISDVTIGGVEVIFTAGQCKDGGWVGSAFRNQGLCVASFK